MASWETEDEWYQRGGFAGARHVRPPPREPPRDRLYPDGNYYGTGGGLHRSRSTGHQPAPNVTIYNTMDSDMNPRMEQRSPLPSPRGRPLRTPVDDVGLEDEIHALRLDLQRSRSRSRHPPYPHYDYQREPSPNPNPGQYYQWQLESANQRIREQDERLRREREEELIRKRMELRFLRDEREREEAEARIKADEEKMRKEYELKRMKEIAEHEAKEREEETERKRIIRENEERIEREERERKEAKRRAVEEYERKKKKEREEAEEEKRRTIEEYERKKLEDIKKQKELEEQLRLKLEKQAKEKKEKEEREYQEFLRKQKEKEEEAKRKKEAADKEFEDQMRRRLVQFGFQENQIQAMINPEKQKQLAVGQSPNNAIQLHKHQSLPTYVKVHRDHLSIETLTYYNIPWEYDEYDKNYIIILREMDQHDTDVLFEHTRRLRSRHSRLLIEERRSGDKPDYAWVRRRASPSPRRRRSSPKRVVGISSLLF
ncbi:hypothetical protein BDY21DRAFT_368932 [Lineolata rhizophorae]|uniref:Uncharacterized protein n=1 Tax=Lineolata rhizophorae TaxID=578093 RepID=A0A6A6PA71_9PEZI|nr:hypothetical protein BDY21DRAFT_368932 [Lineolata rhizophorae]